MSNLKVTTINGEVILKKNARKIKRLNGEYGYFKIGNIEQYGSGDCYQINNIYYTIEKGRIEWDHYNNIYNLKTRLQKGNVAKNRVGYFSKEISGVKVYHSEDSFTLYMNKTLVDVNNYIEFKNNYYSKNSFSFQKLFPRQIITNEDKSSLEYNFKNYLPIAKKLYNSSVKEQSQNDPLIEHIYNTNKGVFNDFTFGIEIETTRGKIPKEVYQKLGVLPVRDGSISGLEYVSIPLTGKQGLYTLKEFIESINIYTDHDFTCSMHIHVGGVRVPRTEEFIVAMFKTAYYIQNDFYQLFPMYKEFHDGTKRQCYTAPLDDFLMSKLHFINGNKKEVLESFRHIVTKLTNNHSAYINNSYSIGDILNHPSDPSERSKWYMKERYKWLNLIPLIFTNKETIEYRIFTVPDTYQKGLLFLLLSLSLTHFVNNNSNTILLNPSAIETYDLRRILRNVFPSSTIESMYYDRLNKVNFIKRNKGAFFEETDVTNYIL